MTRMTRKSRTVIGGVDTHADTHVAAALDRQGRLIAVRPFPSTPRGCQQLLEWLRGLGRVQAVGVEGTGSYGAGLTRHLQGAGVTVIEINQPHAHTRARRGKNDAIDAEAAARKVLAGQCTGIPKDTTGVVEAIRQLNLVRASAVQGRASALHQLGQLVVTSPPAVRQELTARSLLGKAHQAAKWAVDPTVVTDPTDAAFAAIRSLAARIRAFDAEIKRLDRQLAALVKPTAPRTLALRGVGIITAADLLVAAGQNIDRLRCENAFAHLCGAAPIPASSGKTQRHRLNRGGNRAANRALHIIAVVRLRYDQRTRDYTDRRRKEGKSTKEAIRCLKRYVAREIYYTLRSDLKNLASRS